MLSVKPASQEQSQDSRHTRHQYGWERQNVQSLRRRSTFLLHMYWRVLLFFRKIPGTRKRTRWKCRQHYDLYNCFWTFSYLLFSWSLEDDCLSAYKFGILTLARRVPAVLRNHIRIFLTLCLWAALVKQYHDVDHDLFSIVSLVGYRMSHISIPVQAACGETGGCTANTMTSHPD